MSDWSPRSSEEVLSARRDGRPIVALESTLISHGLPWPCNLETALDAEEAVRQSGAVPATIAVIDGNVCVGLTRHEIERLARAEAIAKASPRDLPWLVSQRRSAATTVAGTMFIAARANLVILATGGIGGVHRGASGDVSADLIELSRTPVMVVCSGIKSILDIPGTLEFLETQGVAVVGYGVRELPAFYATSSGLPLEQSVAAPEQAAALIRLSRSLGIPSGIVLANPPPHELALNREELDQAVAEALATAESAGVSGKSVTPFLLAHLRQQIGTRATTVNRALVVQNARLAAQIACAVR
jgi:pseudouridine-5'-phosphate glycosidase